MKKIVFSFIIISYCVLIFSAGSNTWLKNSKLTSSNGWSEGGDMPEDSEESGQEDNREWQNDETYRFYNLFNFYSLSLNREYLHHASLFFASSHFPEIDSPPPQG